MKKRLLIGIISIVTVIFALSFTACNDGCDHQWTDATCTSPKTCSICQETEGAAKGHTPETDDGNCETAVKCSACQTVVVPAKQHVFSDACDTSCNNEDCESVRTAPHSYKTSYDKNETQHWYQCSLCADKKNIADHTFNISAATEESDKFCTVCQYVAEYQLGHVHTYDTELSYDDEGHFYAASCGHTEIKKDFEYHDFDENTVQPTCTEQGYTTYTCSCGKTVKDNYVDAAGHSFNTTFTKDGAGHWYAANCVHSTERSEYSAHAHVASVTAPTCTEQGYTTYTCACGDSYVSDYVDAKGHNVEKWDEASKTMYDARACKHEIVYSGLCSGCKTAQTKTEYIELHVFTVVTVTKATCISDGTQHKLCKNTGCKYTATPYEVITYSDENAHSWIEDSENSGTGYTAYKCSATGCLATKKTVTGGESASVSKDNIGSIDEVKLANATIALDQGIKNKLSLTDADVSISAGTLEGNNRTEAINNSKLSPEDMALLGNNKIYDFTLNNGDIADLGGTATIRIPYTLTDEDPDNIIIWYLKAGENGEPGKVVPVVAVYEDGYVTFTTDHFSYYTVTFMDRKDLCKHLGHIRTNAHTVLPTCTEIGYTVCLRCEQQIEDSFVAPLGHSWQTEVISESSCSANGVTRYSCSACDATYETVIAATGHYFALTEQVNASCKASGSYTYDCIYCTEQYTVTVPQLSHTYISKVVDPTCEEKGYTEKTCTVCADTVYVSFTDATGHTPDSEWHTDPSGHYHVCISCGTKQNEEGHVPGAAATEQAPQICTVCEYVIVPKLNHVHVLTVSEAIEADCVNIGYKKYYTCECGKWFFDEAATQLITDHTDVIIDALGHKYQSLPYVAPSCTDVGYTAGVKCSVCDEIIKGHVEISAHGHSYIISETAPSCTETGKKTEICSYCQDAKPEQTIDALGHKYIGSVTAPTCTEDGYTTFICARCGDTDIGDERAKLGHSYINGWLSDADEHWHQCSRCEAKDDQSAHTPDRDLPTNEHAKTCTKCGYIIAARLNHEHTVAQTVAQKNPGCTTGGNIAYYICECGEWFYDSECNEIIVDTSAVMVKPLDHLLIFVEQTESTCTEAGYTAGYYCQRCEKYLSGHEELPLAKHEHSTEWTNDENEHWHECACGDKTDLGDHVWNADAATEENDKHCTVCEYVAENILPHTHKFTDWKDEIPASCTENGTVGYYECTCGKFFNEDKEEITDLTIPAPGHNHSDEWSSDENGHWHECACGDKTDLGDHVWNADAATEENDKHCTVCEYVAENVLPHTHKFTDWKDEIPASCTENGTVGYYECTCGKFFNEDKEEITDLTIPAPGHSHSDEWSSDENGHWHECACGDKTDLGDHSYSYGTCECGASLTVNYSHNLVTEYVDLVINFYIDGSFIASGDEKQGDGSIKDVIYTGTWEICDDGIISAYMDGDLVMRFVINGDGTLTPDDNNETTNKVTYTYEINNPYANVTITFYSNGTLTAKGWQLVAEDKKETVDEIGSWYYAGETEILATLYGEPMFFIVDENGELSMVQGGGSGDNEQPGEVYTEYTYKYTDETSNITVTFAEMNFNFTVTGWILDEKGNEMPVDNWGMWRYADENIIMTIWELLGEIRLFEIDEEGNLTLIEGGTNQPDATVIYTYQYNTDDYTATLSFESDFSLTASGWRKDPDTGDILEYFTSYGYWYNEDGFVVADIGANYGHFIVKDDNSLMLLEDCPHDNPETQVQFPASCIHSGLYVTVCPLCRETVDNGYIDPTGHSYDEEGYCTVCGKSESDPAPTIKYTFEFTDEDGYEYKFTFMSDYSVIYVETAYGEITDTIVGFWTFKEDISRIDVYTVGMPFLSFTVNEDDTLSLYECPHEHTYEDSCDASCDEWGSSSVYCEDCGDLVSFTPIPPYGHKYDENGYCANCGSMTKPPEADCPHHNTEKQGFFATCLFSGCEFYFCHDCGRNVSEEYTDPIGHHYDENGYCFECGIHQDDVTEPTEMYKFEYSDEEVEYVISFLSNNVFTLTMIRGQVEEGIDKSFFAGAWELRENGRIYTYLFGADYECYEIGEGGKLSLYECKHENTYPDDLDATCNAWGYNRTYCSDCYSLLDEQHIPPMEHSYDETGSCSECGYNPNGGNVSHNVKYEYKGGITTQLQLFDDFKVTGRWGVPTETGMTTIKLVTGVWGYDYETGRVSVKLVNEGIELFFEIINERELILIEGGTPPSDCQHDNTFETTTPATCESDGFTKTVCLSCGHVVSETPIYSNGHSYDENGCCVNCGRSENEETDKSVMYHFKDETYELMFYSDYSVGGTYQALSMTGNIILKQLHGSWDENYEPGRIHAYLETEELVFEIMDGYKLKLVGDEQPSDPNECTHESTYESVDYEPSCEQSGHVTIRCNDCGNWVGDRYTEPLGHSYDENGYCASCGRSENEEPDKSVMYHFKDKTYELMFYSDYSVDGTYKALSMTGNTISKQLHGSWDESYETGRIHAHLETEELVFEIMDGYELKLVGDEQPSDPNECTHESTYESVDYEPSCEQSGHVTIRCNDCGNWVGDRYTDPFGHSYDENGYCVNCGRSENEEPDKQTKYSFKDETYEITFFRDGTAIGSIRKPSDDGTSFVTKISASWDENKFSGRITLYYSDGTLYFDVINGTELIRIDENAEPPMDCKHENVNNMRIEPTCTLSGYEHIECLDCGTVLVDNCYYDPYGHEYDGNECLRCGRSKSDPEPYEIYSFTFVNDQHDVHFSFMSDNTYRYNGMEYTENGTRFVSFVGNWYMPEDGKTVETFILGKLFKIFEVNEDGNLSSNDYIDNKPTEVCKHMDTLISEELATCYAPGYYMLSCARCGEVTYRTDYPIADHYYGEDGHCTMCGKSPDNVCKHENTSEIKVDASCVTEGYDKTVCNDCGITITETVHTSLGHTYVDGQCTNCGLPEIGGSIIVPEIGGVKFS